MLYLSDRVSSRKPKYHPGTAGLSPRNFAKPIAWKVDQDYRGKLSPREAQWLSDFNIAYYGADFRRTDAEEWGREERSEANRDKNAGRGDAYSLAQGADMLLLEEREGGGSASEAAEGEGDWSPLPAYLDTDEYHVALSEFRALLRPGRYLGRDPCNPNSRALKRARAKLEDIARGKKRT